MKFSTRETREEGKGWFVIQEHLRRLQHVNHFFLFLHQHVTLEGALLAVVLNWEPSWTKACCIGIH